MSHVVLGWCMKVSGRDKEKWGGQQSFQAIGEAKDPVLLQA